MFQAGWCVGQSACKLTRIISLMGSSCTKNSSRAMATNDNMFQICAGKVEDFSEGKMKEIKVNEKSPPMSILMVKHKGEISALSAKCTHYGAPLIKGSYCSKGQGTIRCPWHGACFNASTGDIEDFPGLDSLKKYDVEIKDGEVHVKGMVNAAQPPLQVDNVQDEEAVVIVGGGGAAQVCAETLRTRKNNPWKGRIVMITKEQDRPYDRPKLSKAMTSSGKELQLRKDDFFESAKIENLLGVEVTALDTNTKTVTLNGSSDSISYKYLVLATGGSPRQVSVPGSNLDNILYLRSPGDANRIVSESSGKSVVIVGSSFIGTEVAAFLSGKAQSVTIVGRTAHPLERNLGPEIGKFVQDMHEAKGVKFIGNSNVTSFEGNENRVTSVHIDSQEEPLSADVVVVGIGCDPSTKFLLNSEVQVDGQGFVEVNRNLKTNVDDIYAVGDIAKFPLTIHNDTHPVAIGHWQIAQSHGRLAGLNIGQCQQQIVKTVPFFWTVQYGKSLRYAGYCPKYDDIIYDGEVASGSFVAYFCVEDNVHAVATLGRDPVAADFANFLMSGKVLKKTDAIEGLWRDETF